MILIRKKAERFTRRFIISLTDDLYKLLRKKAYKANISIAEVVRQLLQASQNINIESKKMKVKKMTCREWSDVIRKRDNYICQKCKLQGSDKTTIAHHIIAKKKGGKNTLNNGITLCMSCHNNSHRKCPTYKYNL